MYPIKKNNRLYARIRFNMDSTSTLLNVSYKKANIHIITPETDKIVLKYKAANSNNLNDTEKELLKTYDVLVYQEYESLTDSEKQKYIETNIVNAGSKTKIAFTYLRIDKTAAGEIKFLDNSKSTFSIVK
jgi:hypothetical protein